MNKPPKLQYLPFLEITPDKANHRGANEYFPKGEEQRQAMGAGILECGIHSLTPLRISRHESNGIVENQIIGGNRRYWGLESQDSSILSDLTVPCLVYTGLTRMEEIEISLLDNQHEDISPWGESLQVSRLSKLGKKNLEIAKRLGTSAAHVGNLLTLSEMEAWVQEAGQAGKISATLVWQLYNSQKGKAAEKKASLSELLNSKRELIKSSGVTAKDFGISSKEKAGKNEVFDANSDKVKALIAKALNDQELENIQKAYGNIYEITGDAIKSLQNKDLQEKYMSRFLEVGKALSGEKTVLLYKSAMEAFTEINREIIAGTPPTGTDAGTPPTGQEHKVTFQEQVGSFLSQLTIILTTNGTKYQDRAESANKAILAFAGKHGLWS